MDEQKIAIFKQKEIRKIIYKKEWWFVINDVIFALTDSTDPAQYFKRMRNRDLELAELIEKGGVHFVPPLMLKIQSVGGIQLMYCWNTEGIFRLIQSIPSPKAEPFKRWLAKVGYERVQEIEDPELAQKRARAIYKAKGYPDEWIDLRMRGIMIRENLTDEWDKHGVKAGREYEILTAEISKATFGMTPSEYKKFKGLKHQNLRDHMDVLESLFSQLGEAATTEITKAEDPQGFLPNQSTSRRGGRIAGEAREKLEDITGKKVSTKTNFLQLKNKKELK
ncbi:MAG: Bro-N domain-containing protein [bacterium]